MGSTGEVVCGCLNRATRSNGVGRALRGFETVGEGLGSEEALGVSWMMLTSGREIDRGTGGRTLCLSDIRDVDPCIGEDSYFLSLCRSAIPSGLCRL